MRALCIGILNSHFLYGITGVQHDTFDFIAGRFGPLEAGLPCNVPLWFALQLRKSGKCIIEVPDWLTIESLQRTLEDDKVSPNRLSPLPYYYIEIAHLLLNHAKEDFVSPDQTRALLQDVQNIRMDRLRGGMLSIAGAASSGQAIVDGDNILFSNIAAAEVLALRGFASESLSLFRRFSTASMTAAPAAQYGREAGIVAETVGARPVRKLRRLREED